jgi:diguanylate cyclase (GGDEF)-like protein
MHEFILPEEAQPSRNLDDAELRETTSCSYDKAATLAGSLVLAEAENEFLEDENTLLRVELARVTAERDEFKKLYVAEAEENSRNQYDQVTGLKTRRIWQDKVINRIYENRSFSIAFFDASNLGVVNNTIDHAAGDTYLKTCADSIREFFRLSGERTTIAKFGGDEFVTLIDTDFEEQAIELRAPNIRDVLRISTLQLQVQKKLDQFPDTHYPKIAHLREELRQTLAHKGLPINALDDYHLGLSWGVSHRITSYNTEVTPDKKNEQANKIIEDLIATASDAMYISKSINN